MHLRAAARLRANAVRSGALRGRARVGGWAW